MMEMIINFIFSIGLFINAALFIPQLVLLLQKKNSDDVSLTTFLGFCVIQLLTVWHGYYAKDIILMLGFSITFLICGAVTALIIYYRLIAFFNMTKPL